MSNLAAKITKNKARALQRFIEEYEDFLRSGRNIHTSTPLHLAELARDAGVVPINPSKINQEYRECWALMTSVPCRVKEGEAHYKNLTITDAVEHKGCVIAVRNLPVCDCQRVMDIQVIACSN